MSVMCLAKANDTIPHSYIMTIEELTTLEKLNSAFYECAKASQWKEATQRYKANLLVNNVKLQEELRNGTYRVGGTNNFTINERGKLRYIKAPTIRDRVVQKVLCKYVLIPELTKPLIYDNYASLKLRGTTFARKRADIMLRRYIRKHGDDGYILQVDIRKYFDNVDHNRLKELLHDRLDEPREIMDLIDYMVDSSSDSDKGLNLGSEAPQIFAIYYLSRLDNYIKSVKGIKYYGRYMDDMFILFNSKEQLRELLEDIKSQLADLKLEINEKKTHITKLSHGFTYLQIKYRVKDGKVIKSPTHKKIVRERRRLKKFKKQYEQGKMTELQIYNCYISWRNSVVKDCNACKRTIDSIDRLYNELFPVHEVYIKGTRSKVIKDAYRDLFEKEFEIKMY